ncbi:hypothetical protein [Nonomuraea sp. JJY05]|uniref:hypothetical protein n=1 Tax=Nonomuraea sp. JJY05 TaxID=3350255 RepID=UPI00373F63D1
MTLTEQEREEYSAHADHFSNNFVNAVDALALIEDATSSLQSAARLLAQINRDDWGADGELNDTDHQDVTAAFDDVHRHLRSIRRITINLRDEADRYRVMNEAALNPPPEQPVRPFYAATAADLLLIHRLLKTDYSVTTYVPGVRARIDAELQARPPGEIVAAQQDILAAQEAAIAEKLRTPVAPVAVVITKPGYDTVRIGPIPADYAPTWIATLDKAQEHVSLPEGSKWEITAYDPKLPHEQPTAATTVPALIPIVRERIGQSEEEGMDPARFPDEYVRMWALIGEEEAYQRWRDALMEVDAEIFAARTAEGNETR